MTRWWVFVVASFLGVVGVFGVTLILERTVFENAPFESLRYLYVIRGASASFLVLVLAGLFFQARHRKTEERLHKLARAMEQSPSSVVITDGDGRIEYVNPHFTKLTGYTREETIGKNPRILQSGQTPRETYKNLWETITNGREWHGEFLNRKKNGELYWEAASISLLRHSGTTHYVGVLEDISAQKKLDHLKDELIGTVSHELRTPLSVIKMAAANLKDGLAGPLKKEQRALVETVERNSERLERMICETLDLARLESGKARIHTRPVSLETLVPEVVGNFRVTAEKRDVTLDVDLPPHLPEVFGDSDMLDQVLSNLLENAIRYARKKVTVRATPLDQRVQVTVGDDGMGITHEDLGRLFSKFERIHNHRPTGHGSYKGTGLGLAIAKEIIQQHRGTIWAESEVGQGAKFHFTLPTTGGSYEKAEEKGPHH